MLLPRNTLPWNKTVAMALRQDSLFTAIRHLYKGRSSMTACLGTGGFHIVDSKCCTCQHSKCSRLIIYCIAARIRLPQLQLSESYPIGRRLPVSGDTSGRTIFRQNTSFNQLVVQPELHACIALKDSFDGELRSATNALFKEAKNLRCCEIPNYFSSAPV